MVNVTSDASTKRAQPKMDSTIKIMSAISSIPSSLISEQETLSDDHASSNINCTSSTTCVISKYAYDEELPSHTPHSSKTASPNGTSKQSSQSSPLLSAATQPQSLGHESPPQTPAQS